MAVATDYFHRKVVPAFSVQSIVQFVVISITLYLVTVPLAFLLWTSLHGAPSPLEDAPLSIKWYVEAYGNPATYRMLLNTLVFALGAVSIGLTMGVMFAWLLERTNVPGKSTLYGLVPLPMIMPGMLAAIAWILILSPRIGLINVALMGIFNLEKAPFSIYTLGGMFFVQGMMMVPTQFLMMVGAFRSMDPTLEEASSTAGAGMFATMRQVTFPLMFPAILSAAIYSFTSAIEAFEIPGVIGLTAGIHVFSSRIYLASRTVPVNYSLACTFAVTFVFVSILNMIIYTALTRRAERYATITGKGYRPRVIDLGRLKWVGFGLIMFYLFVALILPAGVLMWGSLLPFYQVPSMEALEKVSFSAYKSAYGYPQVLLAFKNSLIIMAVAATFTAVFGSVISWIVVRTKTRGRYVLDTLSFLPQGIPSIVLGLALLLVYLRLDFIPIYGTIWILVLAFSTRYMTFSVRTMNAAMHQIHKELEEAAAAAGAGWWRMFTRITMPLLFPSLLSVWLWTAMLSVKELSAAIMLSSPGTTVISVVIWDMWEEGMVPEACVLGVTLIGLMAIVNISGRVFGFRVGRRGIK